MKALRRLAAELDRRDPVLAVQGWVYLVILAVVAGIAPFDSREILGLDPWVKPAKFLVSITVFLWTVGWLLHFLTWPRWAKALVRWGVSLSMAVEIFCIVMQSVRGTRSHFNFESAFDGTVFGIMGIFVGLNTALMALMMLLYLVQRPDLPAPYLWGIRLGLVVFLLASLQGVAIVLNDAHAVGVPDGGRGLPFVNWSTEGGDLRIAHFVGLNALQAVPLFGWLLTRLAPSARPSMLTGAVVLFAIVYGGVGCALYLQAVAGRPLLVL
jgi:hypothetical protein